jgi:hypothetical protein
MKDEKTTTRKVEMMQRTKEKATTNKGTMKRKATMTTKKMEKTKTERM